MDENNFPDIFDESQYRQDNQLPPVKRLERSGSDVIIAGVCSGIAKYFDADPSVIRLISMLALLLGGWSAAAYLITAVLLPIEISPKELMPEEILHQKKVNFKTVIAGGMITAGIYFGFSSLGFFSSGRLFVLPNSFIVPIAFIAFGIKLFSKKETAKFEPAVYPEKFLRSANDKKISGVCGGIAKYIGIDSTTVRIVFLFAALLTLGIFSIAYILFALFTQIELEETDEQTI